MNIKVIKLFGLAAILILLCNSTFAATADGTEGATSTGTLDVTLEIPDLVKITGVSAINLGTYSGTGDETGDDDMCVFQNDATNTYIVNVTTDTGVAAGSASEDAFFISSGDGTDGATNIEFTAYWNDATGTGSRTEVTFDNDLAAQSGAAQTLNCGGGNNANFSVVIAAADMQTMPPGTYDAQVTILITPTP